MTVKGGSWKSEHLDCRTEHRGDGREELLREADKEIFSKLIKIA